LLVAFYERVAEGRFVATQSTRGPWDVRSQHAGPPAALLGRAIESVAPDGTRVARVTFDIARPVPVGTLDVTASVLRSGRSVTVVSAAIEPYMRCTAVLIRTGADVAPAVMAPPVVRLSGAVHEEFFSVPYNGYHTAMEVRFSEGSFVAPGPATAWMRMRMPLVDAESPTPLQRVLIAADSGNGISNVLDFGRYLFVNVDLSVHLLRYPAGEWVCLQSVTSVDAGGIGLADTGLHDEFGQIGRSTQSLFVAPRELS
jgi:hypothetical protein